MVSFQILHFREIFLIRVAPHSELKWLGLPTHITVTSPAGRVRPIALRPGRAQSFTSTGFVTLGLQPFLVLTGSRTTATLILLERVSPNVRFHYAAAVWPLLLSFPISPGECMSTEHRIISGSEARQTADRFMSRAVPFTVEQRLKKINKRLFQVKGLLFSKCMLYFPMYLINQVKLLFFLLVHHVTFIAETKAHLGQFANR